MPRDEAHGPPAPAPAPAPSPPASLPLLPPPGYTLMFAGRRAGKTGLLRLLLDSLETAPCATPEQARAAANFASTAGQATSEPRAVTLDVRAPATGDAVRLTLLDTPALDFDAAPPGTDDLCALVEDRYRRSLQDRIFDQHVHLCIYVLDPDDIIPAAVRHGAPAVDAEGPSMPQRDLQAIRRLTARVNVLPVIARADSILSDRLESIKKAVAMDLMAVQLTFGIFDDGNLAARGHPASFRSHASAFGPSDAAIPLLPYALVTPDQYIWGDGVRRRSAGLSWEQLVRQYAHDGGGQARDKMAPGRFTRRYRWGVLDVLDPTHCDFVPFRDAIFGHMQALKTFTFEHLFAEWKRRNVPAPGDGKSLLQSAHPHLSPLQPHPPASLPFGLPAPSPAAAAPSAPGTLAPGGSAATSPPNPPQFIPGTSQYNLATGVPKVRQKKILVACNFCRTRKLKCDGGRPACAQCIKRSNHCDYQPVLKRRGGFGAGKAKDECCDGDDAGSVLNGNATTATTETSPAGGEGSLVLIGVKRPLSPEPPSEEDRPLPHQHQHQHQRQNYTPPRSAQPSFEDREREHERLPPIADMDRDRDLDRGRERERERPPGRMPVSHLVDDGGGLHGHAHTAHSHSHSHSHPRPHPHPQLPPIQIPQPTHLQHLPHSSLRTQDAFDREREREREKMALFSRERVEWDQRDRDRRAREWEEQDREREAARRYDYERPPPPHAYSHSDAFSHGHGHRRTASLPGPSPVMMHPDVRARMLHQQQQQQQHQQQAPGPSPTRSQPPGQLPLPVPPPIRTAGPPSPKIHMDSAARADKVAMQLDKKKHGIRRSGSNYGPKTVACNFCRTRKTKCDGQHPKCGNCQKRSLACEYLEDQRRRSSHAKQHSADQDAAKAAAGETGAGPDAQRLKKLAPAPSQQQLHQQQQHEAMSTASSSSSGRSPPYVHHHAFEDSAAYAKRKAADELGGGPPLKRLRERSPPAPPRMSLGEMLGRRPLTPAAGSW